MKPFTPFVDWIDDPKRGFRVKQVWDSHKNQWIGPGNLRLFSHQRRILAHCLTPNEDGTFPYTTILYSCPKKSGKTAIAAAVGAWYAEEAEELSQIYCIANDQEQSEGLVMGDIAYHAAERGFRRIKYKVELPNGTYIQALAQSFKSIAGSRHGLTLWDELWGYSTESSVRAWDEMTPIPTVPNSLRFISTYAGFENESNLLWELYLQGVGQDEHDKGRGEPVPGLEDLPCYRNGRLFVYWDHEGRMPWQTQQYYDEQMISLRPSAFIRLHTNSWVTSHEAFIPVEWWEKAEKKLQAPAEIWQAHPYAKLPVVIGVDAAIKRDCTAAVGVAYNQARGTVGVVFHRIWTPRSDEDFDLEQTIERTLIEMDGRFNVAGVVYDPAHLHQSVLRLKRAGLPMMEYTQTQTNMTAASQALYDVLKFNTLEVYPDEELKRHVQMAVAEEAGRGFRIVKEKNKRVHIDAAVALAMAVYTAIKGGGVDISHPVKIAYPFSDRGRITDPTQAKLPFPLRTDYD